MIYPRNRSLFLRPARSYVGVLMILSFIALLGFYFLFLISGFLAKRRDSYYGHLKVRASSQLRSISTGLEMFRSDYGHYPDSSCRADPIRGWPESTNPDDVKLTGAHWLARALLGYNLQGIDKQLKGLSTQPVAYTELGKTRHGSMYIDPDYSRDVAADTNQEVFRQGGSPATGRYLFYQTATRSPILYYRANTATTQPFAGDGQAGIYNHLDNAAITGGQGFVGWDFAGAGNHVPVHPLGVYESAGDRLADRSGQSFKQFLSAPRESGQDQDHMRPYKPDSFLLISAGFDGLFGTEDDITNFPRH